MAQSDERYDWTALPFVFVHVAAVVGAVLVGASLWSVALCFGLYYLRMFAITGGYHRYFAHRTYKTSRAFQFFLALLGGTSVQKGALWWAAHHRDHHRYSDTDLDIHSPIKRSFWFSHVGWFLCHRFDETRYERIKDFAGYPELVFLNRYYYLPPLFLGGVLALFGWEAFVWGFLVSTTLLWHGTFTINSLAHVFGKTRYDTGDSSKNSMILALITMGEGWHNNHHFYQSSTNQGFFWWEIDLSYYVLRGLSWCGVVWDLRTPPDWVLRGEHRAHGSIEGTIETERAKETLTPAA